MRNHDRSNKRLSPMWVKCLFAAALVGVFGSFIGGMAYAWMFVPKDSDISKNLTYVRLLCAGVISVGIAVSLGTVETALNGVINSQLVPGGKVYRKKQPVRFWLILGLVNALALAIIAFGLWRAR